MANLSPEQEAINAYHIKHRANYMNYDQDCAECKRIPIKEKLDREKEWEEYCARNGILYEPAQSQSTKQERNSKR